MKIKFETLKIEGFAGITGYAVLKLDSPGMNIIKGPNGVTKTTRISALSWVLYGKTLKDKSSVGTWLHKQPENYRGTKVSLSLTRGNRRYTIIRCHEFTEKVKGVKGGKKIFVLDEQGEYLWPNLKDKRDIQAAIEEFIGISHRVFINAVIFPQKVSRFIEASGADRKKIFEDAFKASWILKAKEIGSKELKELNALISKDQAILTEKEKSVDRLGEMLSAFEETRDEFLKNKEDDLAQAKKELKEQEELTKDTPIDTVPILKRTDELETQIEEFKDKRIPTKELRTKRDRRGELNGELRTILRDKTKIQAEIADDNLICSKCGQELKDKAEYIEHRKLELADIQKKEVKLTAEKRELVEVLERDETLEVDIDRYQDELQDWQEALNQAIIKNLNIDNAKTNIEAINKRITKIESREFTQSSRDISQSILDESNKIEVLESKLKRKYKKRKDLEWAIKTPLGSNGISTFIFSQLVELVNAELLNLEQYTQLGVTLSIEGDRRKDIEATISRDGYPIAFYDLSGGESSLVNVMISIAIGNVVSINQPFNIRVFDESFESLSPENVDKVGNMIAGINPNISTFIITHLVHFNPTGANQILLTND